MAVRGEICLEPATRAKQTRRGVEKNTENPARNPREPCYTPGFMPNGPFFEVPLSLFFELPLRPEFYRFSRSITEMILLKVDFISVNSNVSL